MTVGVSDKRREAISRRLAQLAGDAPDSGALAEAISGAFHQLTSHLVLVIGARGVHALFMRSLHLTRSTFPWLAEDATGEDVFALIASIKTCLAGRDADAATAAGVEFLVTFTALLSTLIGESLAESLLAPVWVSPPLGSEEKTKP